jgi:hypothetical protein
MFMRLASTLLWVGSILLSPMVGCAPLKVPKTIPWPGQANKPQTPLRTTAFWTDSVLNQGGLPGVSGFGARVLFYGTDDETPIIVDGSLTVYGYDDTDGHEHSTPARKFVFPAEYLEKHYSKSDLGHSYSIWIPWQEASGPQRQISLILRFESRKGGAIVISEMSRHTLPGFKASDADHPDVAQSGNAPSRIESTVRQSSHETEIVEEQPPKEKMSTTTITLPPRLGRAALSDSSASGESDSAPSATAVDATRSGPVNGAGRTAKTLEESKVAPTAGSQAAQPLASPADRFARLRRRVPAAPRVPPTRGPLWTRPSPAEWPSGPRPIPQAVPSSGSPPSDQAAAAAMRQLPSAGSP